MISRGNPGAISDFLISPLVVKNRIFPEPPYPTWTAIGVNWLAGFDFEIKVIARIPEQF